MNGTQPLLSLKAVSRHMKYNWQLLENGAMFLTFSELEQHLAETGHPDYPDEMHRIRYAGKGSWKDAIYAEIENSIGKDTWVCNETTDGFKAKYGMAPGVQLGGEFSLEDAGKYCKDKPRLRAPEQFEFEKEIVRRWLVTEEKESRRGRNPKSLGNLKHVKDRINPVDS